MASLNLHTLHSDILHEVLALSPDLTTLRCLIGTHPAIYRAFLSRRRLILKIVFRKQTNFRPSNRSFDSTEADKFVARIEKLDPAAGVAFRESIWPALQKHLQSNQTLRWAIALLATYQNAGLNEEELFFARRVMGLILDLAWIPASDAYNFAKAVIRTYLAAGLIHDAIEIQELIRRRTHVLSRQHSRWSKELIVSYRKFGHEERILPLQLENWDSYKIATGPENEVTLEWARAAVCEYKNQGKDREALQFWQTVRSSLTPTCPPYIAWSRYMMHMYKRQKQDAEALTVVEEVWRNISPEVTGYRAWAAQLSEQYESAGRSDDAIAVCEAAWTAINERLMAQPHSRDWNYQTRGAGLLLSKVYRRHERCEEARAVEARCHDIR
jgi:hypothetical protein